MLEFICNFSSYASFLRVIEIEGKAWGRFGARCPQH
jgi:hypothetical protein